MEFFPFPHVRPNAELAGFKRLIENLAVSPLSAARRVLLGDPFQLLADHGGARPFFFYTRLGPSFARLSKPEPTLCPSASSTSRPGPKSASRWTNCPKSCGPCTPAECAAISHSTLLYSSTNSRKLRGPSKPSSVQASMPLSSR